ncbi:2-keto-3-deoxy-L-rhamnonate aldolase RhmA [Rhizobium petrolearium]|uniref:HpcH/HpaI aldolase family protein n=1 Tax=Neorhizobium petrolearium TaxID=515361 RepID=UPI001AE990A0|nr:aldolase/citrate lyase family protein [Neorhizobium petrolearium]MBP1845650.1 2-keto-3-deoxy-L-rhamnonate aldolase RhmA [Neorhizobium petrolearium]
MNRIKQRLLSGEFVTAAWAEMGSPDNAEAMVRNGWSVILIDGEHGIGDLEQWVAVARAVEAAGGQVILRVPNAEQWMLNRALDRGFQSILVPRVNSAAEARSIADFCRYPPHGSRGYAAPIVRASGFGARQRYALEEAHEELLLMIQCEHVDAVENIGEIASVPGIDAIFIGPNDLSGSANHLERMLEPLPQALIKKVEDECARQNRMLATIVGAGRSWGDLRALGYRLVIGPNDVSLIVNGARQAASERDEMLGITGAPAEGAPISRY